MITAIIPAYKSTAYIEDCLDSVHNQVDEMIVGVDCCDQTLNKIVSISHKYNNLRVLYMEKNKGCYITLNTLLKECKTEYIQIFNADDIMTANMINKCRNRIEEADIVRMLYYTIENGIIIERPVRTDNDYAWGCIMIKKSILDALGGFKGWRCAADADFVKRANKAGMKVDLFPERMFYYRRHPDALTKQKDTKLGSSVRIKNKQQTKIDLKKGLIKIKPIVNQYIEI